MKISRMIQIQKLRGPADTISLSEIVLHIEDTAPALVQHGGKENLETAYFAA